jgi:hypothetical protein
MLHTSNMTREEMEAKRKVFQVGWCGEVEGLFWGRGC